MCIFRTLLHAEPLHPLENPCRLLTAGPRPKGCKATRNIPRSLRPDLRRNGTRVDRGGWPCGSDVVFVKRRVRIVLIPTAVIMGFSNPPRTASNFLPMPTCRISFFASFYHAQECSTRPRSPCRRGRGRTTCRYEASSFPRPSPLTDSDVCPLRRLPS
ncbi:hypothetical protein FB45DRAFT_952764 [Roridomyces roridus]|uniref:Uncharacterized protein n=1 Tax=Roridomyces roridus TaxID=1738132 RepID=A0AAD7B009_9AGAR|nr:hypothetical protein FB45DRAFT_952764 [Roridomyces roridus]